MAAAYRRTLLFETHTHAEAQQSYEGWLKGEQRFASLKPMQDYIAHAIFRWANEQKLLLQVHTGYQEGNDGYFPDADPSHLIRVILQYPDIRFDLFHMGFPYQSKIGAMGKKFPNVYLNLCWMHILSPIVTQNTLHEWIQQVPLNKIFAFGGDCLFYDGVVGHLELAKRCVANVLTAKVQEGFWVWKEAEKAAQMLFYLNPKKCYQMEE